MAARHGNQHRALQMIACFEDDVDALEVDYPNLSKFARAAREFSVDISNNAASLINYGERFRSGERISSCLAESTVNAIISKRFAKRQQMQWTPRVHIFCCRRAPEPSTAPCALSSSGGIPAWPTTTRIRSPRRRPDRPTKPDALRQGRKRRPRYASSPCAGEGAG